MGRSGVRVTTGDDRQIRVRRLGPDDRAAVRALYRRLPLESLHSRFFTGSPPPEAYFDRLVTVAARGGVGLVAETAEGLVVGDVGVEPLENGNGELAVTIDPAWRGWLGPYLVATAGIEAASLGMPGLELQVLTSNGPMRAITWARGEAFLAPSDWHDVRLLVASVGRVPGWPPSRRLRVLVEQRHVSFDVIAAVDEAGWLAVDCAGRTTDRAIGGARCPVVDDRATVMECVLASGADVIVVAVGPGPDRDRLVEHHRRRGIPVAVVDPDGAGRVTTAVRAMVGSQVGSRVDRTQMVQTAVSVGNAPSATDGSDEIRTDPVGIAIASDP
jgi:hypothetical protein